MSTSCAITSSLVLSFRKMADRTFPGLIFVSTFSAGCEMYQTYQLSLWVLYALIGVCLPQQPCIYPSCSCTGQFIYCNAKNMSTIPTMVPTTSNYSSLSFEMNSIMDIPAGSLPPNLSSLTITNNPITTIADTAFDDSAFTMDSIYLSFIRLTRIPDAFSHLKTLKYLDIEDVNILDWNEDAMRNIGQTLITLDLDNVSMSSWPTWLKYFSNLTDLTITRGSFSSVPDDILDNMTNTLTNLFLSSNDLVSVPKAFSKLSALQSLSLEQNRIVDVSWLPQSNKLTYLTLSNNLISDAHLLSKSLRQLGDSVLSIYIDYNRLSAIPDFSSLKHLQSVDLSNNKLTDSNSGAFPPSVDSIELNNNFLPAIPGVLKTVSTLYELLLSYNSITHIRASDFPNSTSVDLGYNLITELTENCFPENTTITSLYLNNNPITTISISAFNNLANLTFLSLKGTRLSRLPLALGSLRNVDIVDISSVDTLVCTCLEKSLATWVLSKPSYDIDGTCGLMDIYHFFSELSPLCP